MLISQNCLGLSKQNVNVMHLHPEYTYEVRVENWNGSLGRNLNGWEQPVRLIWSRKYFDNVWDRAFGDGRNRCKFPGGWSNGQGIISVNEIAPAVTKSPKLLSSRKRLWDQITDPPVTLAINGKALSFGSLPCLTYWNLFGSPPL